MDQRERQGQALRAWREEQAPSISQKAAGERLASFNDEHRAATQAAWAAWERGEKSPDLFFAFALERMTNGKIAAQGWAVARKVAEPNSSTNLAADVAHRSAG